MKKIKIMNISAGRWNLITSDNKKYTFFIKTKLRFAEKESILINLLSKWILPIF